MGNVHGEEASMAIEISHRHTLSDQEAKKRSKTSTESIMGQPPGEPSSKRVRVNDNPPHPIQSISLSEKKPYKCDFEGCDYACNESGSLKTHKRTHSGENPYKCDFEGCDYACKQSGHLKTHKMTHTKEGQARQKKQEQRVAKALDLAGYTMITAGGVVPPPMHYKREHHVDFVCVGDIDGSYARVDFVICLSNGVVVFLEVDEDQHRFGYGSVACDMKRMSKIYESITLEGSFCQQMQFLRYNPNSYRLGGVLQRCTKKEREKWLLSYLTRLGDGTDPPSSDGLAIHYAYYDRSSENDECPEICYDPHYEPTMRSVVDLVV